METRFLGGWRGLSRDERRLVAHVLGLGLAVPVLLAFVLVEVGRLVVLVVAWCAWFGVPAWTVLGALYRWSQTEDRLAVALLRDLRPGLPEMPLASGAGWRGLPVLTLGLVAANVGVHHASPDLRVYAFPLAEPSLWLWANLTSLFVHFDGAHLWGNMIFLAVFGSSLEGRIPRPRLLVAYLLLGSFANAVSVLGFACLGVREGSCLGASGAISGLMGLFVVRCHGSRVSLGMPLLGWLGIDLHFVSRLRLDALCLTSLFFLLDLRGIHALLRGHEASINYYAHVGGYVGGLALALASGLFREAAAEATERRALSSQLQHHPFAGSRARDGLIARRPDHVPALLARARARSRYHCRDDARADYERAVRLLLASDRRDAAGVFAECFRKYRAPLDASAQLRLTPALESLGEREVAVRALELAAASPGTAPSDRSRALLHRARILRGMGLDHAAAVAYETWLRESPESPLRPVVQAKLAGLAAGDG